MEKVATINAPQANSFSPEEIAKDIQSIAEAMRSIDRTRLSRKAIVELIHSHSRVGKRDIEYVLNNLATFDQIWLKPIKANIGK